MGQRSNCSCPTIDCWCHMDHKCCMDHTCCMDHRYCHNGHNQSIHCNYFVVPSRNLQYWSSSNCMSHSHRNSTIHRTGRIRSCNYHMDRRSNCSGPTIMRYGRHKCRNSRYSHENASQRSCMDCIDSMVHNTYTTKLRNSDTSKSCQ